MVSEILECPIDDFLDCYAPFTPAQESVDYALQSFKNDTSLEEVEVGNQKVWTWKTYKETPARSGAPEATVFRHLQDIVGSLGTFECREKNGADKPRNEARIFSYRDCPSTEMKSEIPGTNFRVDACITSDPGSTDVVLSKTAVIAEFKKEDKIHKVMDVSSPSLRNIHELNAVEEPLEACIGRQPHNERRSPSHLGIWRTFLPYCILTVLVS